LKKLNYVELDNCREQYAVINIVTGKADSYERHTTAEASARRRSHCGHTQVVIDLHTGRITDVFGADSRLTVGIMGVRFEEYLDNE
jgi:hypothetical protein